MTNPTRSRRPTRPRRLLRIGIVILPLLAATACWAIDDTEATILRTTVGIPVMECASARRLSDIPAPAILAFDWGDGSDPDTGDPAANNGYDHCRSHTYDQPGRYEGSVSVQPGQAGEDRRALVVEVGPAVGGYVLASTCTCHNSVFLAATGIQSVIGVTNGLGGPQPNTYIWTFDHGLTMVTSQPILPIVDLGAPGTYQVTLDATRPAYVGAATYGPAHARTSTTFTVGQ